MGPARIKRARQTVKYEFVAAYWKNQVVLQTRDGFLLPPANLEAAFQLCMRHSPGPALGGEPVTPLALLAVMASQALTRSVGEPGTVPRGHDLHDGSTHARGGAQDQGIAADCSSN